MTKKLPTLSHSETMKRTSQIRMMALHTLQESQGQAMNLQEITKKVEAGLPEHEIKQDAVSFQLKGMVENLIVKSLKVKNKTLYSINEEEQTRIENEIDYADTALPSIKIAMVKNTNAVRLTLGGMLIEITVVDN